MQKAEMSVPRIAPVKKAVKAETVTLRHLADGVGRKQRPTQGAGQRHAMGMVDDIAKHLKKGRRIRIGGLGILQVRKRPARMGRNPATGEAIKIKASKKIAFRAAKDLKEADLERHASDMPWAPLRRGLFVWPATSNRPAPRPLPGDRLKCLTGGSLRSPPCACSPPRSPPRPTPSRRCRPASRTTRNRCSSGPASIRPTRRACAPRRCSSAGRAPRPRASTLIEGSCFAASPAGTTNRADYEFMRDEILGQLQAAMPVDGVLLGLHGAMVAHGYDDVEGDIIERARAIVGPKCVIGVELDPHCHMTMKRVATPTSSCCYKEFPHTDVVERAEDVLELVLATLRGQDQAGHVGLRLPADPELSDDAAADARASSIASRRWRARTASCRSRSRTAFPMPTCRRSARACW